MSEKVLFKFNEENVLPETIVHGALYFAQDSNNDSSDENGEFFNKYGHLYYGKNNNKILKIGEIPASPSRNGLITNKNQIIGGIKNFQDGLHAGNESLIIEAKKEISNEAQPLNSTNHFWQYESEDGYLHPLNESINNSNADMVFICMEDCKIKCEYLKEDFRSADWIKYYKNTTETEIFYITSTWDDFSSDTFEDFKKGDKFIVRFHKGNSNNSPKVRIKIYKVLDSPTFETKSINPLENKVYDLGKEDKQWKNIYSENITASGNLEVNGTLELKTPPKINGFTFNGKDSISNFFVCNTPSATVKKEISNIDKFNLIDGVAFNVYFNSNNSAENPTLNINNTGDFPIYANGQNFKKIKTGQIYTFIYYNGIYHVISGGSSFDFEVITESNYAKLTTKNSDTFYIITEG